MSAERWLPVVGWEGLYEVSDHGRVKRVLAAFGTRPGKLLRPGLCRGYPIVGLCREGRATSRTVHQLVAEAFIGPRGQGMEVDHADGDRSNNNVANLEYVSGLENIRRARALEQKEGRFRYSMKSPRNLIGYQRVSDEEKAKLRAVGRAQWLQRIAKQ